MSMWDKIILKKRYVIENINELLKNKTNLKFVHNFIMNVCSALAAYCFFENNPEPLSVYKENTLQLFNISHLKLTLSYNKTFQNIILYETYNFC